MAFRKYARAITNRPSIDFEEWMEELRDQNEGAVPKDFVARTAKTILRKCDPKQYLLSHATIVASVDTYAPKNVKTGRSMNRGIQVDVRWPDFRIKPECHEIINNNGDAWDRSLLLSSYRTFIGAHNYLEHIQLPELSKGFIVDAIARDLGKSCYIDILVATDRKHQQLVSDILTGAITGLSMGCVSQFTICNHCGNVAADDSQICPCIQYDGKGSKFIDDDGIEHPLSELIGHVSVPNSNQFIEASWVRNPAFRGAVRRQILNPNFDQLSSKMDKSRVIQLGRSILPEIDGLRKSASTRIAQGEQQQADQSQDDPASADNLMDDESGGESDSESQGGSQESAPAPSNDMIDKFLQETESKVLEALFKKLSDKLAPKPEDVGPVAPPADVAAPNNNLVRSSEEFGRRLNKHFPNQPRLFKWAMAAWKIVHERGVTGIRQASMTSRDLIILSWIEDRCRGKNYDSNLYKIVMATGAMKNFPSETSYLAACKAKLGRDLSVQEQQFLTWKGRISSISNG